MAKVALSARRVERMNKSRECGALVFGLYKYTGRAPHLVVMALWLRALSSLSLPYVAPSSSPRQLWVAASWILSLHAFFKLAAKSRSRDFFQVLDFSVRKPSCRGPSVDKTRASLVRVHCTCVSSYFCSRWRRGSRAPSRWGCSAELPRGRQQPQDAGGCT